MEFSTEFYGSVRQVPVFSPAECKDLIVGTPNRHQFTDSMYPQEVQEGNNTVRTVGTRDSTNGTLGTQGIQLSTASGSKKEKIETQGIHGDSLKGILSCVSLVNMHWGPAADESLLLCYQSPHAFSAWEASTL